MIRMERRSGRRGIRSALPGLGPRLHPAALAQLLGPLAVLLPPCLAAVTSAHPFALLPSTDVGCSLPEDQVAQLVEAPDAWMPPGGREPPLEPRGTEPQAPGRVQILHQVVHEQAFARPAARLGEEPLVDRGAGLADPDLGGDDPGRDLVLEAVRPPQPERPLGDVVGDAAHRDAPAAHGAEDGADAR